MWDILARYCTYSMAIFLVLATAKGVVEVWGKGHQNKGGEETSKFISWYFIIVGSLTPVIILCEILFLKHSFPLVPSLILAAGQLTLLAIRVVGIKELGRFYSVNIRIDQNHTLVNTGVYSFLRHPLYLIGILENVFYPLACGAYISALLLTLLMTPALLLRRREEEQRLTEFFGDEYRQYQNQTWF